MENQTGNARKDVYAIINQKIIEQLEKGTVPWLIPWSDGGLPKNLMSGKSYRGINIMLLGSAGYPDNSFLTFKQLNEIGGKVKKGEKGHMVVFWDVVKNNQNSIQDVENSSSQKKAILRYYIVFNVSQCENIPERFLSTKDREVKEIPSCESVVQNMPQCPVIKHKEQRAYYHPKEDFVNIPKKKSFKSDASYYSTLFHELVHSTGHESRLNRQSLVNNARFGDETYSLEELVAEIGTCYLQSFTGITKEFEQSGAYIQGWLQRLKNDKRFIFTASHQSQKATDFILNVKQNEDGGE
ncbi:MAG: zincin-like metallopeptidase domain-containing protein [bacterium]